MAIRDLIPWGRQGREDNPVLTLQRDINRMFEDFWKGWDGSFRSIESAFTRGPRADIAETEKEVEVSVEVPGLDETDIEVTVVDGVLTVKGEKKSASEEKKKDYILSERSYGMFHRSMKLPPGVDEDKAQATFKNGVLTVVMPKTEEAKANVKRITVTKQ